MKLLVCDYDNTLKPHYNSLACEHRIPVNFDQDKNSLENNVLQVNNFLHQGDLFLLSTGRHYEGIIEEIRANNINFSYLSCNNGTELYDKNGNLLYCKGMDVSDIMFIKRLKLILDQKATVKIRTIFDNGDEKFVASSITIHDKKLFDSVISLLKDNLNGSAFYYEYPKIRIENKYVNKVDTIEIIKNLYDVSHDDIYVIGDNLNDLKMIEKYKGYTLQWGVDDIKKRAIWCYDSVAEFIEDVFLKNVSDLGCQYKLSDDIRFKITDSEYDFIIGLIQKYRPLYLKKYQEICTREKELLFDYDFFAEISLIKEHDKLIEDLITSLLKDSGIYDDKNICTFFSGSFARGTNKSSSDLDFHFAYNCMDPSYVKYEEIFYYVLSTITNEPRGRIHPMIFTAIDNQASDYIMSNMSSDNMRISLECDEKTMCEYQIDGNIKKRMYLQLYGSKDLSRLKDYLLKWSFDTFPHEWINNFKITSGEAEFNSMYNYICNQQYSIDKYLLSEKVKKYVVDLDCFTKRFASKKLNSTRDVKIYYQQEEFKRIFNFYSLVRNISMQNGNYIKFNNLLSLMQDDFSCVFLQDDHIISDTYRYLWKIKKLVSCIKDCNLPYSIHSTHCLLYSVDFDFQQLDAEVLELNDKIMKKLMPSIK